MKVWNKELWVLLIALLLLGKIEGRVFKAGVSAAPAASGSISPGGPTVYIINAFASANGVFLNAMVEDPPNIGAQVNLPYFGQINFAGAGSTPAIEADKQIIRAFDGPQTILGPVDIDSYHLLLYGGYSYRDAGYNIYQNFGTTINFVGSGRVFGQPATIALESLSAAISRPSPSLYNIDVSDFTLLFVFPDTTNLQIIPGQTGSVTQMRVHFSSSAVPQLTVNTTLFGYPVVFQGALSTGFQPDFSMSTAPVTVPLTTLVPKLSGTAFQSFTITGPSSFVPARGGLVTGTLNGATPGSQAIIEPIPGAQIILNDATILYSGIGTAIKMDGTFNGAAVTCWGLEDDTNDILWVVVELTNLQLTSLIPELHCPDLDQIYIDARIAITNNEGVVLCGNTSGSPLTLFGVTMQQVQVSLDTINKNGFIIGRIALLGLPLVMDLSVDWSDIPKVALTAELPTLKNINWRPFAHITADIPGFNELIKTELSSIEIGIKASFEASIKGIKTTFTQLKNAYATIFNKRYSKNAVDTKKGSIENEINAVHLDPNKQASPYIAPPAPPEQQPDPDADKTINATVQEYHTVAETKRIQPGGITFQVYLKATGNIFGFNAEVDALLGLLPGGIGTIVSASFPDGIKPSDLLVDAFGGDNIITQAINLFKYGPTRLVFSTIEQNYDTLTVEPGITVASSFGIDPNVVGTSPEVKVLLEALNNFVVATGTDPAGLTLYGTFNPLNPLAFVLKMGLSSGSFGLSIPPTVFNSGALNLTLRGQPTVGVEGTFTMIPTPGAAPLQFASELLFGVIDFGLAFSMKNIWQDPFGLTGLSFGNLGIKATQSYANIIAAFEDFGLSALIPSQLAMTGQAALGVIYPISGRATVSLGTNVETLAIVLEVNNPPTLPNIVAAILEQRGVDPSALQPILNFIPINILAASIYFVPITIQIGNITVDQGIGFDLSGQIFGQSSRICASLDLNGIVAKADLPEINFGDLFKLTNAAGTGGAEFDLLLSLTKGIGMTATCRTQLLGVFDNMCDVSINTNGMKYHTHSSIGPAGSAIYADVDLGSISFTDPLSFAKLLRPEDLTFSIVFADSFTPMVIQWVNNFLTNTLTTYNNSLNMIIEQVARNTAMADILEQQAVVAEKWAYYISINPWSRPLDSFLAFLDWAYQGTLLLALQVKYAIEQTPFGQFARQALEALGLVPIINTALTIFRDAGVLILRDAQIIFNDLANLAVFRSAQWAGTVKDILQGVIPGIIVDLSISGQENTYNLGAFDMKDPVNSAIRMATNIGTLAQNVLTNALNTVRSYPQERFAEKMKRHPAMGMFRPIWDECRFEVDVNNPYYQYSTFAHPYSSRLALPSFGSQMAGLPQVPDDEETVNRMKGMVSILETIEKLIQATDFGKYAYRLLGETDFRQAVVTGILQTAQEQGLLRGNYGEDEASNTSEGQSLQKVLRSGQSAEMKAFVKEIVPSSAVLAALKDDAKERARTGVMKAAGELVLKLFNASNAAHGRAQLKISEVAA